MHVEIEPKILYVGTPVVLVSTTNPDDTPNLAPLSSIWALGWTVVLGLGVAGQTLANLERTGECVLNFPHAGMWSAVERLAPLTGREAVPAYKVAYGARYEPRKFEAAQLTPTPSACVAPPRVAECPLQLEARVRAIRVMHDEPDAASVEVRVIRVHADIGILTSDRRHIDPARWQPLIYNFRHYFGLGPELGRSFRARTPVMRVQP